MAQEIFKDYEDYLVDKHQPKETRIKLKPVKNDRSAFEKLYDADDENDKNHGRNLPRHGQFMSFDKFLKWL